MFELFLTEHERERVAKWKNNLQDSTLTTRVLSPFWEFVVRQVPDHVAPNVLSLAGLLCLMHAWYLCYMYMDVYPRTVSVIAALLAFTYQTLDAIDGKHAHNIRNSSPIGELFDNACDNVGSVFLMLTLCSIMGIHDIRIQWYIVQTAQLVFLQKHFTAFRTGVLKFSGIAGPGEALFLFMVLSLVRALVGFDWVVKYWPLDVSLYTGVVTIYTAVNIYSFIRILSLPSKHVSTRNGLAFCLLYRVFPALVLHFSLGNIATKEFDVICDGVFMSVLTSDIILAKMAGRELHPWVVVFAMLSIFHNLAALMLCVFYYVAVFSDLCWYMKLPLFTVNRNVYVCGVYDLCHLGHMRSFENALKFGTRLFVGVCNDEDVASYKRKPIMTHKERCDAVAACKFVHTVIPNAPLDTPAEFIEKHDIHVVALSEEYDTPTDKYYADARRLGVARILPRTQGMSTSELIRRIKEYDTRKIEEK